MSELTFVPPAVQEAMVIKPEYCAWTQSNVLDVYDTSCENEYIFYFMEFQDAGFLFCPYCGNPIKDVPYESC
jgi:hypothetical protein